MASPGVSCSRRTRISMVKRKHLDNDCNKLNVYSSYYTFVACRNSWLQSLEQNISMTKTPADNLLFELNVKMCTVGILCTLLRDCELGSVLSVLHHPGNCNIYIYIYKYFKIHNFLLVYNTFNNIIVRAINNCQTSI